MPLASRRNTSYVRPVSSSGPPCFALRPPFSDNHVESPCDSKESEIHGSARKPNRPEFDAVGRLGGHIVDECGAFLRLQELQTEPRSDES
jgi:hypothetical protein